jgi:hypothetical protein
VRLLLWNPGSAPATAPAVRHGGAHVALFAVVLALLAGPALPEGVADARTAMTAQRDGDLVLVADPGFEQAHKKPCFVTSSGKKARVKRTRHDPLRGKASLDLRLKPHAQVSCQHSFGSAAVTAATVRGSLRIANRSRSRRSHVDVCLEVRLAGQAAPRRSCRRVKPRQVRNLKLSMSPGPGNVLSVAWTVSAPKGRVEATVDDAQLVLTPGQATTSQACDPSSASISPGVPAPGSAHNDNELPATSTYHPAALTTRSQRPYLPLDDYVVAPATDPVAQRFQAYVDRGVGGHDEYGYEPADAIVLYARTGQPKYLTSAIASVDAYVSTAEQAIAAREAPAVAGDSYLEAGPDLEQLALAYDWGYAMLTDAQRCRWKRFGDQVIANLWTPRDATWGGAPLGAFDWSGWSINNPGNNYNFSFMQATQMWAVATGETAWMSFLQTYKFPLITNYYQQLTGGGSREGTGYGTAQRRLFANARLWAVG